MYAYKNPARFRLKKVKEGFFIKAQEDRNDQQATVVGVYSAKTPGPGESWHLHGLIQDENISAHVDDISTNTVVLSLPQ